ncbi:MAG: acylphosphatase [Alphaproteobacteria bacterium]|nr:acylphosphatase [Alphaproteobacteria bacterium]
MNAVPAKSVRVLIRGRVQGVWFRGWTVEQARSRGLFGWVRNLPDGTVEALFSGPVPQVDDMTRACHQGPRFARVDSVGVESAKAPVEEDFHEI